MNVILFFAIKKHNLTVVGVDATYTKPLSSEYVTIGPGQTVNALLSANQKPDRYYIDARAYSTGPNPVFDNSTTTAIVQYRGKYTYSFPSLPSLPFYNDTNATFTFFGNLKSLDDKYHPIGVPLDIGNRIMTMISKMKGLFLGSNSSKSSLYKILVMKIPAYIIFSKSIISQAPDIGLRLFKRFGAIMNNISFVSPSTVVLQAYYQHTNVNTTVEIVLQGTTLLGGIDHLIHLNGYNFYIVGFGFRNFDIYKYPLRYSLKDPPLQNTAVIPIDGWITMRFKIDNPERHMTWGMKTIFIVKDGEQPDESPPPDIPPC
ncbi:hypothetical protein F3Y22_tig00111128pilonHSYRG00165 [Hibiscus syriacus]|uniref:Uncharacterized protein n=1 Tax=Hibiscus syriacus TaxID=106335 RepID=A0A6A2YYB3_HIBSY|nr:hypothetical protein F3Y22_tig00111128pilonHSYRG00165 [Hibiscus syriacus]